MCQGKIFSIHNCLQFVAQVSWQVSLQTHFITRHPRMSVAKFGKVVLEDLIFYQTILGGKKLLR